MHFPIAHKIDYQDPWRVFSIFEKNNGSIFLDSVQQRIDCGRYSFIATDPFLILSSKNGVINRNGEFIFEDPFNILEQTLNKYHQATLPNLPPFQGGVVGYFGYE